MKDRQAPPSPPQQRIFIISDVLHCISMTVIVFLRSSFGIVYLRPKSVFLACSWAFGLYAFYAWHEEDVWMRERWLCLYGVAAVALYVTHLLVAIFREIRSSGEHDYDSGTSHLLRIKRWIGKPATPRFTMRVHIWVEPLALALLALALRFTSSGGSLSMWLLTVAPCLSIKEGLNAWFEIRHRKRHKDSREDAEDIFDDVPNAPQVEAPKAARKEKVKRERPKANSALDDLKEQRCMEILRLLPGYTIEQAEQNYRTLLKQYHPDQNSPSVENTARTAELNESIDFIRQKSGR